MFSKYYQGELAFLRDLGREYAAAHPAVAGLLAERGTDPDVERLLEGFAFLSARLRERLDDAAPELIEDLSQLLLPHYLRPIPAATVVEFLPVPGALRARAEVPAGAELASVAVEGVSCRFRTTAPMALVPATLTDAALDQAIGATPTIRLQLQAPGPALPAVFQDAPIRFFIHGELPFASTLLLWIARHLTGVRVRGATSGKVISLGPNALRLVGFDPDFPLLPWPPLAPPGSRTLQEYFTLPQKFLFFELRGLGAARDVAEDKFDLLLDFDRPPELPARITRDTFRLNCAPVINLFPAGGEPIRVSGIGEEHLIRAAGMAPRHVEIHSIDAVRGLADSTGAPRTYHPFFSFGHGPQGAAARYYRVRRRHHVLDGGIDCHLSLLTPRDGGTGPAEETLSIDLTCTNRGLTSGLRPGDVSVATQTSPSVARFRNILPVSKPARPPLGSELHWRLVSHLAVGRVSVQAETLRTMLGLYNFQALADQVSGRANHLRIDGIRAAEASAVRRVIDGAPVRGTRISLELDEGHFAGLGDAVVFGGILDELFAAQAGLNTFAEVAIRLQPSGREYQWAPRNGTRALL